MPLYESECTQCGATGTYVRKIDERKNTPECSKCGGETQHIISAVRGFADLPSYQSPIDGREIRGRHARREDMKRSGCREYEGFEQESREAKRIREHKQKQIEARIDEQIERTISDLDASNKLERIGTRDDPLPDFSNTRVY